MKVYYYKKIHGKSFLLETLSNAQKYMATLLASRGIYDEYVPDVKL
jgi:hypothetical protein